MVDPVRPHLWRGRLVFVGLILGLLTLRLLPVETAPGSWPWPDLVLVVMLVWVARRPDLAPTLIIAALAFLTDLVCQRPPGAWSAVVLLTAEGLRARHGDIRTMSVAAEWGFVTVAIIAVMLGNRLVLAVSMSPLPPLGLTLLQVAMSIVATPLVMAAAHLLLGVRRPGRSERNTYGRAN